jgi:transcriptional regulator with XRE-family HTH domain
MSDTIGRRIFLAHLELNFRLGRKVTLDEFGEMIAKQLRRRPPFTSSAVSRWEANRQTPTPEIIEAIAAVTQTDPGWLSHGERSAAPRPMHLHHPTTALPKRRERIAPKVKRG